MTYPNGKQRLFGARVATRALWATSWVTHAISGVTSRCQQVAQSSKLFHERVDRVHMSTEDTVYTLMEQLTSKHHHTNPLNPYPPGNAKPRHKTTIASLRDIV